MNFIDDGDIIEFLKFVLVQEKKIYNENPMPTAEEKNKKYRDFRNKIETMTKSIAEREGIYIED